MLTSRAYWIAVLAMVFCTGGVNAQPEPPASDVRVVALEQGQVAFESDRIRELSGITYTGHDRYLIVSDKDGEMAHATIKLDPQTGAILSAKIHQTIHKLHGRKDAEAIAFAWDNTLIVADEAKPGIYTHDYGSGAEIDRFDVPKVFKKSRSNRGFEALSLNHRAQAIWAANEEALKPDGPKSTTEAGTLVRLQRFSFAFDGVPTGQFAYRTDPHRSPNNVFKQAQSGVSGLIALDAHRLIVMERELGGMRVPNFRVRLYLVDIRGAQDTSDNESLADDPVEPVKKTLLIELDTRLSNFEGITLGPKLANGDHTLILVSDNGGEKIQPQNLLVLRLSGLEDK